jgi:hypothetical protein
MKIVSSIIFLSFMLSLQADPLGKAEIEGLLKELETVQDGAHQQMDKRYKSALDDFQAAMQSDDAAITLYLKCVEKIDFTDLQKKGQEFRDWRRNNDDRMKNPAFRQALRHQLSWLSLTLRAAARPEESGKLSPEVLAAMNSLFANVHQLAGQGRLLTSPVTESVFFKAYEIGELPLKTWPTSPLQIGEIYDSCVMPGLRRPDKITELAAAWDERMRYETSRLEYLSKPASSSPASAKELRTPEMIEFSEQTLPDLKWKKEIDLYQAGDQRAAALRMLNYIKANVAHRKAVEWVDQFKSLVNPKKILPSPVK